MVAGKRVATAERAATVCAATGGRMAVVCVVAGRTAGDDGTVI